KPKKIKEDIVVEILYLKNTIKPLESLVFLVGQMEIINNKFYGSFVLQTSIRSKLLITYQNITENSKNQLEFEILPSVSSYNLENKSEFNLSDCFYSPKCVQTNDSDKYTMKV
ncbi:5752_t:CDS:2, partial [Scutellospora calospora]